MNFLWKIVFFSYLRKIFGPQKHLAIFGHFPSTETLNGLFRVQRRFDFFLLFRNFRSERKTKKKRFSSSALFGFGGKEKGKISLLISDWTDRQTKSCFRGWRTYLQGSRCEGGTRKKIRARSSSGWMMVTTCIYLFLCLSFVRTFYCPCGRKKRMLSVCLSVSG